MARSTSVRCLRLLLLLLACFASRITCQEEIAQIPHVSECSLCKKCYLDTEPLPAGWVKLPAGVGTKRSRRLMADASMGKDIDVQSVEETIRVSLGDDYTPEKVIALGKAARARLYAKRTGNPLESPKPVSTANPVGSPKPVSTPEAATDVVATAPSTIETHPTVSAHDLTETMFQPGANDASPKHQLRECSICHGCNTRLMPMASEAKFFDRVFRNEKGASSGWLFQATTNRTASGRAVLKVYCMPIAKRVGGKAPTCAPGLVKRNMKTLLALQKLSEQCGFNDLIPKVWVERVDAVIPEGDHQGVGYHIRWHGLWMEFAEGVSLENFLHKGEPAPFPPSVILDVMKHKMNKTQVIKAAIFDLLTSQCDRHSQNVFINQHGQLSLIDNEVALQSSWKNCGFDSILVPGTQKQEIIRLSNEFVLKLVPPEKARKGVADPQLLLDYRCYLPEGAQDIKNAYPINIGYCLKNISDMTVQQVWDYFGFDEELPAQNLHSRATDMLTKGFEWAAKYGDPRNADPKRYRMQPKCCDVIWKDNRYTCAHPWEPKFELPVGDMTTGKEWKKDRPDTGTYQGGTHPEDDKKNDDYYL